MVTEKLIETVHAGYELAAASCPTRPEAGSRTARSAERKSTPGTHRSLST